MRFDSIDKKLLFEKLQRNIEILHQNIDIEVVYKISVLMQCIWIGI